MSKNMTISLVAILALAACSDANEGAVSGDSSSVENSTTGESVAAAKEEGSNEKQPAQTDKKNGSQKVETSNSSPKTDPGATAADCKITSIPGDTEYKGDCEFIPHGGGSFTTERSNGQAFVDGITAFVVELDTKTVAGMSVRDANGDLVFLGSATKSSVDGACWETENHSVCVYAK